MEQKILLPIFPQGKNGKQNFLRIGAVICCEFEKTVRQNNEAGRRCALR